MKFALAAAAVLILALLVWKRRKRLGLALNVAAVGYGLLFVARIVQARESTDRWWAVGLALGVVGGLWLLTWVVTTGVLRLRRSKAQRRGYSERSGEDNAARSAMAER